MTWTDLFRIEVQSLHAHEEDIVLTLERIRSHADGAHTHEVLMQLIEAAPSRQGRLDVVVAIAGWEPGPRAAQAIVGWESDVDDLLDHHPKSVVIDAMILGLVLKITRLRTAGYEAAYLLAENLDAHHLSNLLRPLWIEDREGDERAASVLAALVRSGGRDWDESFRLSQNG